ncbi:unnamed protein product, partial [Ectocarpus sp. 8 AP-2014]
KTKTSSIDDAFGMHPLSLSNRGWRFSIFFGILGSILIITVFDGRQCDVVWNVPHPPSPRCVGASHFVPSACSTTAIEVPPTYPAVDMTMEIVERKSASLR